jgi:cytochrome P450
MWRTQRKAGLHFLSSSNLRVLTEVALPQYLDDAVDELKEYAEDGVEFDLQEVFHDITTGLMGKMAYNMEMRPEKEFTAAFEYASGKSADRVQNPLWPVTEIFTGAQFRKALRIVKKFGKEIVTKAVHDRSSANGSESGASSEKDEKLQEVSGSLIQSLLDSLDNEEIVADAALNYLSAGRDTTAQTLTWAFYELMRHPHSMATIRDEVSTIIKLHSDTCSDAPNSVLFTPTSMPYTTAVFYEALRLYPPIPVEIKQTFSPTTLPDGTFLPTGTVVVWCIWAVNRSRYTWGKDADVFKPERWLEDGKFVPRSAAEFPVFNGGARMCLGKRMAEVIGVQVIAMMAWLFDFRNAEPGVKRWSGSSLTLPMEGGLPSFVSRRTRAVA